MINLFYENLILVPALSFVIAVFIKWIIFRKSSWKWDLSKAFWSWWMPSVHSAVVVSLTTAIAIKHWPDSDFFAIAMAFTLIIIYDSINVRFEAWLHASAINESIWEKKFKESLGHLPSEVFVWSILGVIIAIITYV